MGMITEGDALSSIEVFAKGSKTAQSTVHPVMTYRGTFTRTLFDASWEKKKTIIVAENAAEIPAFTVRYTLFGEGGYNEVAERTAAWYRQQTDGQTARAADAALTPAGSWRRAQTRFGAGGSGAGGLCRDDLYADGVSCPAASGGGDARPSRGVPRDVRGRAVR